MGARRGVRSFVTDKFWEDGSAERGGVPVVGHFWRVVRGGQEYAGDFTSAAEARRMVEECNRQEQAFWALSFDGREEVLRDAEHGLHEIGKFLAALFRGAGS